MIDGLKPYPKYKDSGVPWLAEVPEHWEVQRLKYLFREVDERSETGDEEMLSVSHLTGVTPRREKSVTMFLAESNVGHKRCAPGDVVVNTMWAWMAALGVARQHGLVSPSYAVYRPLQDELLEPMFVDRLLRTEALRAEYVRYSTGVNSSRMRLYPERFLTLRIPLPPFGEQRTIARFLAHLDQPVARYIRAKNKLIALLNEQKQAIIDRTVMGGLAPNIRLKDSGVESLGRFPEGWAVARLRSLVEFVTSGSRAWSGFASSSGPLFLRIGNLKRGSLDLDLSNCMRVNLPREEIGEARRARVQPGDVLLSITAYIGSVAVIPDDIGEAYVSQHVACCRFRPGVVNPKWIGYVLLSNVGQAHGILSMYGGTKQGLSLDDVNDYPVMLPPRAEQDSLVAHIDRRRQACDATIANLTQQIRAIREFRTRLIADVVSGKVDVREAAVRLPLAELADELPEIGDTDEESADESEAQMDEVEIEQ